MEPIRPVSLDEIEAARDRIVGAAIRTPLVPLEAGERTPGQPRIWLKLECLQRIGSFKIRGAANAMALADPDRLAAGVYTGSAGNMAQGVAYAARRRGIPCRVVIPESAPRAKVEAIERLGAVPVPVPFDEWWAVLREHGHPDEAGYFIHPVSDPHVIAGHGTIGLEILDAAPQVGAVVVPYGGGGLSCGIASALAALAPTVPVYAAEVETAAPFAASLEAGEPVDVDRVPTFVDGIGGSGLLPEMWPLASTLLAGSLVVSIEETCEALRRLVTETHVVAEGAGAAAVAAAPHAATGGDVVAVVSGGNIDTDVLRTILEGGVPA